MIRLNIPFEEKDQVKLLAPGHIRWDAKGEHFGTKTWYFAGPELPAPLEPYRHSEGTGAERTWILSIPFTYHEFAKTAGARWDATRKVTTFTGRKLPIGLTGFECQPFSRERLLEDKINGVKKTYHKSDGVFIPRPHQVEGIAEILRAAEADLPGFLLGDSVGLGKTVTSWEAAFGIADWLSEKEEPLDILIVAPHSALGMWRSTLGHLGVGQHSVMVINYEQLSKVFEIPALGPAKVKKGHRKKLVKRKVKTLKGIAKFGTAQEFDLIIWDEAHYLCNLAAARTKLAFKLYEQPDFMIWMSATAGEDPLQLGYLAPLLAALTESEDIATKTIDVKQWIEWCKEQGMTIGRGQFGRIEWAMKESGDKDEKGKPIMVPDLPQRRRDCQKLHKILFDPVKGVRAALRRNPTDIAGWPEINRILMPVELEEEDETAYNLSWEEFKSVRGIAPITKAQLRPPGTGNSETHVMVQMLRFRQKASILRTAGTVDLCLDLLKNGHQVAISCEWMTTVAEIETRLVKEKIAVAKFTGENRTTREDDRLRYQRGAAQVILFTVKEAVSFHQGQKECGGNDVPRSQIDHDIRWGAKSMEQIDGRSHRDGKFAQIYWMYAADTAEEIVGRKLLQKVESQAELLGDNDDGDFMEFANLLLSR